VLGDLFLFPAVEADYLHVRGAATSPADVPLLHTGDAGGPILIQNYHQGVQIQASGFSQGLCDCWCARSTAAGWSRVGRLE
jgi:hypothetical protein